MTVPAVYNRWILITFFACCACMSRAGIIHVPADQPTIQAGIDAAAPGDTVLVADGVYTGPGNRDLILNKAITLASEHGMAACTIDCQLSGRGIDAEVDGPDQAVVQGFTI